MNIIDDAALLKMAEAEILGEAKRAAVRHSIAGVSGWQPCPKPNKLFLANTLLHTVASNRLLSKKLEEKKVDKSKPKKSERKLLQKSKKSERTNFIYKKPDRDKKQDNIKATCNCDKNRICSHRKKCFSNDEKIKESSIVKKNVINKR